MHAGSSVGGEGGLHPTGIFCPQRRSCGQEGFACVPRAIFESQDRLGTWSEALSWVTAPAVSGEWVLYWLALGQVFWLVV